MESSGVPRHTAKFKVARYWQFMGSVISKHTRRKERRSTESTRFAWRLVNSHDLKCKHVAVTVVSCDVNMNEHFWLQQRSLLPSFWKVQKMCTGVMWVRRYQSSDSDCPCYQINADISLQIHVWFCFYSAMLSLRHLTSIFHRPVHACARELATVFVVN